MDSLAELIALPNLHPALVHFPIALAPVAVLFDLAALLQTSRRSEWARGASALWLLAAVGAWASWWAGGRAADSLVDLSAQAQAHIGEHSDWGLRTLWVFAAIAVARLILGRWLGGGKGLPAFGVVLGLGACVLVGYTADLGGGLVYQLGVAVAQPAPMGAATASAESSSWDESKAEAGGDDAAGLDDPADRLETREDGTIVWSPAPEDAAALGTLLQPVSGASVGAVRAVEPDAGDSKGLTLEAEGRTLLTLAGTFGNVEVAARVDLGDFEGTFGLAHHVRDATNTGLLTVRPSDGTFTLLTLEAEQSPKAHDETRTQLPAGPLELAVSAAGRHLRGTLAGELVVHGHAPALPEGSAGILLDGEGSIRIERLVITPLDH